MREAFKASRLIGMLALLAGLMAVSASGAQAEGTWLESGATITTNTWTNAKVDKELVLLTKVGLSTVEILCPKIKLSGIATLTPTGGWEGKIHFEECITKLNKTEASKCRPRSSGSFSAGLIETEGLQGSLGLFGGTQYFKLFPTFGSFVTLSLGTGECAIGNNIEITGEAWIKDCQGKGLVDQLEHLVEEESFFSSLRFGGNPATVDGSAWVFLQFGHTFAAHV